MNFQKDCIELFGTDDLYQVLNLEKNKHIDDAIVKKAYYRLSILWHPDRFTSVHHDDAVREMAKRKFQVIGRAYSILGNKEKRSNYDQNGIIDDDDEASARDWEAVWRGMFKKVTQKDIQEYLEKFRGSTEEMEDVKKVYNKFKGHMDKILENIIGARTLEDEDRIRKIINHCIESGELMSYDCFVNEPNSARTKRMKRAKREAKEAEQILKEMQREGGSGCDDHSLKSMIQAKQQKRAVNQDAFLDHLTKKYASEELTKKSRKCKK